MTYSILACDLDSGELGGACQSHFFNAGVHVLFIEPGVGAVAAQMMAQRAHGVRALASLRNGISAEGALQSTLAVDPAAATRQVAVVDASGRVAAHTGAQCVEYSSHSTGKLVSAQAAMCASPETASAMVEAYERTSGPLAERLLAALEAGEERGGDLRGQKAAALTVVSAVVSDEPWNDRRVELRVEDHPRALDEMRRLLALHRLHGRANAALESAIGGKVPDALAAFSALECENADDPDIAFRHALVLALTGQGARARERLEMCYACGSGWRSIVERLPQAGLLPNDSALMAVLTGSA